MGKENTNLVNNYGELKALERELLIAQRDLKLVKSGARRRKLREYIDDLRIEMGCTLLDLGNYEKGLALFESLSWSNYGEAKCNGIGRALTEMGHYDEARKILQLGLKKFPKSYALWVAMGGLCDSLGDYFGALECFEAAIQFAPEDNSAGLYNKALALIKLGCYGDALPIIEELIERYPGDPKYLVERGALALDMEYPQEAVKFYQKAMEFWQQHRDLYAGICVYTGLCTAYAELGMKKEAMEVAPEGLKKFPDEDPVLYHNVGAIFYEMGWREEAMEVLKKGVKKFPDDEELKKFLKDVEDDMDDPDGGEKPPILGLILLMALLYKKMRKK